jgi:nucleoside phosphorylase
VAAVPQVYGQRRPDLAIVAAHPLELIGFGAALDSSLRGELHGVRVAAMAVGVGMAAAGAGTARALLAEQPRALVLIGSCGVYSRDEALTPGCPFVPTRVMCLDSAVLHEKAAFPAPMPTALEPDAVLCDALAASGERVMRGALATTLGITTDDDLARELSQGSGCAAENLEALAVGLACQTLGVTFGAVLGCTNDVGAQGRVQWAAHHALAARTTAKLVLEWLAAGAHGLPPSR